ncbi:MAG TPA: hypothetical protein PK874_03955 [Desulfobacteraceae bacterium]|nr:hypothetical protein [Desulfobacteraceae bacterium]
MKTDEALPRIGVVTSRQCPFCGHHEIGITTQDGSFYPLKPGTLVQAMEPGPAMGPALSEIGIHSKDITQEPEDELRLRPWVPGPVKGDKSLRLKYGVMVEENIDTNKVDGTIYQRAFLLKLQNLIDKEIYTPLPVILDRFFSTPHLASGNSENISLAMWQELDEIREPVELVKAWLESPGDEQLNIMLKPYSKNDIASKPVSDEEFIKEMEELSLEEFLELL